MYKTFLKTLLLMILPATLSAQVVINQYPVPDLHLTASALFNADLQNTSGQDMEVYVIGSITDKSSGQIIATATTGNFILKTTGVSLSLYQSAAAYQYSESFTSKSGSLPYGKYLFCLKVYNTAANEESSSSCVDGESLPLSPPLLVYPENTSEIYEHYPLLTWLSPMPANGQKIFYDLVLSEIQPNQTPYDAIQRNFENFKQVDIPNAFLQYPANALKLEEEKNYAWKIVAKNASGEKIGETEIWTFRLAKYDAPSEPDVYSNYIIPGKANDSRPVTIKDSLKISMNESALITDLKYSILDASGNEVKGDQISVIKKGNNQFVMDLSRSIKLKNKAYYTLIIQTPKGEKRYIKFRFTN